MEVKIVPEGTGRMIEMLERNEADVAVAVTDALLVANRQGRQVQVAGVYVHSPLTWAVLGGRDTPTLSI
ncbi:hypothetical protein EON64_08850, partial [archaeon]